MRRKNKMKINYIISKGKYCGLNTYASNLQNKLNNFTDLQIIPNTVKSILGVPYRLNNKNNCGLVHFTNQELISPLVAKKTKFIVTVHDLTVKKMNLFDKSPSKYKSLAKKLYEYKLSCLSNADGIIAVSNNTKQDIINEFNISEEKIKVIYEAADESFKQIQGLSRKEYTLLYVGNEMPHKNLEMLFKAIALAKKTIHSIKLIKIGSSGWPGARAKLINLAQELKILNNIEFKENVLDLCKEYNLATALILPSLYEGFGLPILESMACACPIICSNVSSIPEIAQDAAQYFNPTDAHQMAQKIIEMLQNDKLRTNLAKKGLERNKMFSWDKCANETADFYKKLVPK